MGIRFQCHVCQHAMHVKEFLAGKKSRCPNCDSRFRVPFLDQDFSIPLTVEELAKEKGKVGEVRAESVDQPQAKPQPIPKSAASLKTDKEKDPGKDLGEKAPSHPPPHLPPKAGDSHAWLVKPPTGGEFGPADDRLLREWIREHRVTSHSLLWHDGMAGWKEAKEIFPELFASNTLPQSLGENSIAEPVASLKATSTEVAGSEILELNLAGLTGGKTSTGTVRTSAVMKKFSKRRRQMQLTIWLSLLAILLLVAFVVILIWNPASKIQPKGTVTNAMRLRCQVTLASLA